MSGAPVMTLDGPGGAGKGTLASALAICPTPRSPTTAHRINTR